MIVRPPNGGDQGEGIGWWGCEYLSGLIRAKYDAISSEVGGSRSSWSLGVPAVDCK